MCIYIYMYWEMLSASSSIVVCSPPATDARRLTPAPQRRRGRKRCWCCGSTGHKTRTCPKRGQEPVCYRCGERGVFVRTCPFCGDAWRRQGPFVVGKGHPFRHRYERESRGPSGTRDRGACARR